MEFSAQKIAELLNGKVEGDPNITVNKITRIEEGVPGSLSFLANPKYTQYIYNTKSSIVLVNEDFLPEKKISTTLIRVDDAYTAFAKILEAYNLYKLNKTGIAKSSIIAESAKIGENSYIGDFVFIGDNVVIGENVKIYPNTCIGDNNSIGSNTTFFAGVKLYDGNSIGSDCIIHAGVVIGSDGFGFAPQDGKDFKKVAQIGNVIIEDNVEIGANTTIDKATIGSTIIRKGVKLDNLIQIAHNVEIGENTVIAAQTGVAGSTKIGKNCMIAAQAGFVGHLKIGDNVMIAGQAGIHSNVKDGSILLGSPAFDASLYKRTYVHFKNLIKIVERISKLEGKSNK